MAGAPSPDPMDAGAPSPGESADVDDLVEDLDDDFEARPWGEVDPGLDRSCLSHPSHDLEQRCDVCDMSMCAMCAVPWHEELLCADCVELRVRQQRRQSSGWRGWGAMVAGLVAVGALLAPFTVASTAEAAAALPGGRVFFAVVGLGAAVCGVALGASAQDFQGMSRRAGVAGAAMSLLVLSVDLIMKVLTLAMSPP